MPIRCTLPAAIDQAAAQHGLSSDDRAMVSRWCYTPRRYRTIGRFRALSAPVRAAIAAVAAARGERVQFGEARVSIVGTGEG